MGKNDTLTDTKRAEERSETSEMEKHEEDDGRTVADMSGVQRGMFLGGWHPAGGDTAPGRHAQNTSGFPNRQDSVGGGSQPKRPNRPWEDDSLTKEERRMYVLGAMKAALLIGLVYVAGAGILIALLLAIWMH